MAFNLLAVSRSPLDWSFIHEQYHVSDQMFELFPIADPENCDALGISIPTQYFNEHSWKSASTFLSALAVSHPLEVYDLYAGHAVNVATYIPDGFNAS